MTELERVKEIVARVDFPGYTIDVIDFIAREVDPEHPELHSYFAIFVRYHEPDVMTGVVEEQRGRLWVFPSGQEVNQLVQTCFKAIMTSLEHRAREHFTYRGKPVLMPHQDLDRIWDMMPDQPIAEAMIFGGSNVRE